MSWDNPFNVDDETGWSTPWWKILLRLAAIFAVISASWLLVIGAVFLIYEVVV